MAFRKTNNLQFVCDTKEDLQDITNVLLGTECFVIKEACEYKVMSNGEWVKLVPPSSSSTDLTGYATEEYVDNAINTSVIGRHGEGENSEIFNDYANNIASGKMSHAEGNHTIATGEAQHAQGKYNIEDTEGKHAFIIGNGSSDSERSNAFTVDWNGDTKMDGWLDTQGLQGNTLTRNLYIGGAKDVYGTWEPGNPFIIDYAEKYPLKNQTYVSTMGVPKEGRYWLTAPEGSNYIYKIQILTKKGTFTEFDINSLPTSTAGQYGNYYEYNQGNFVAIFGNKTRVDSNSKVFPDGTQCDKRFNMQNGLNYYDDNLDMPYPAIKFDTDGAATVKVWWVAGDANRPLTIQTDENGGSSRLEVSGNFIAHGNAEFNKTAKFNNNVDIDGRLETYDVHVDGFIETTESIKCHGNIEIENEIKTHGSATFENDVKIKNNANREHTVKLRDALHEALDFDFKKRIPFNADELMNLGASWYNLKEQIEAMREISATTLTLNEEECTFEIGDEPIEIWKDFALKGISEKPVVINFSYTGTADEFTVFKVMAPDLKISLENLVINSIRVNGGYGNTYIIKYDENAINSNLLLNKIELQDNDRIDIYQGNSIYLKETKAYPNIWSGSVKNFYTFNDKEEFEEYYEKLTDYIEITDNYQGYYSSTEGANCSAADASHAEGVRTTANPTPWYSEGEPYRIGGAHAEGYETQALATPSHAEGYCTIASGKGSHVEGSHTAAYGDSSHAEGFGAQSSGQYSHAEGYYTTASGNYSHAQGKFNIEDAESKYAHIVGNGSNSERSNAHTLDWEGNAWYSGDIYTGGASQDDENAKKLATEEYVVNAINKGIIGQPGEGENAEIFNDYVNNIASGKMSHAEGSGTQATKDYAHAEGQLTEATGMYSHAEGRSSIASASGAHAEGYRCEAKGQCSHAEGNYAIAKGSHSHAEGSGTIATATSSHVQGAFNIEDTEEKYLHIVGNGTGTARSNAHTIDKLGNGWYAGEVYIGGTSQDDADAQKLTTEDYVDDLVAEINAKIDEINAKLDQLMNA